jgi:hypothetical protein
MKKFYAIALLMLCITNLTFARTYFVSTTGNDANVGTIDNPYLTINYVVDNLVQPGDTIFVRGGIYMLTTTIRIKAKQNARVDARIYLWAYNNEKVVLDGSQIPHTDVNTFKMARCIYENHEASYWHFKGLELCNAKDNGMKEEGSYNIIENCKFHDNNDSGLQIGMYKDFTIEETKSLPAGDPQFNPGYQFCRGNIVINCDSYYNYDAVQYNGSTDDGGDADGFSCKLFPGPGTEFHGCRAWNNSDDNWDMYMVYHPVLIDNCWCWKGGYDKTGVLRGNGNGFKLGGGGTSGGAAFAQSIGAHVVHNCVSFENGAKGVDQNNAYEAMYIFNNVAWGNAYNYRFPTILMYGTMYMRNNIGWGATVTGGNHEFLSVDKTGSQVPNTAYNSWTTIDGCDPYKEGNKVNGVAISTKDHSSEFKSLSSTLFLAARQSDGSLPDNDFAKLKAGSIFVDKGEKIENFALIPNTPEASRPVGYVQMPNLTIPYNDGSADMGAYETGNFTQPTLALTQGSANQTVYTGSAMSKITYKWGGAATDVTVTGLPEGVTTEKDAAAKTVSIIGNPTSTSTYTATTVGGVTPVSLSGTITISTLAPATLVCSSNNASQTINIGSAIADVVFQMGGGATSFEVTGLPVGLSLVINGNTLTISGTPTADGAYVVKALGGMTTLSISGNIACVIPTKVLTGDWYHVQDSLNAVPNDLKGVITLTNGSTTYPVVWNSGYSESGTVPAGCTIGAINVERGGSISWTLPSLVALQANLYFTGGRTIKISTLQNGVTTNWTSGSLGKGTYVGYNLLAEAGIADTKSPIIVTFTNMATGGGIRIYDFYVKVYDNQTAVNQVAAEKPAFQMAQTETALIVYGDIAQLKVYSVSGSIVEQSILSQVVSTHNLTQGIYVVQIQDKTGRITTQKFIKR